jgi:hypothetical protein
MGKNKRKPISATKHKVIVAAGKIPDSELEDTTIERSLSSQPRRFGNRRQRRCR